MKRESIVFVCGFLVIIVPFFGVPASYKEYLLIGIGSVCMLCGYSLRRSAFRREIEQADGEHVSDSFAEHIPTASLFEK